MAGLEEADCVFGAGGGFEAVFRGGEDLGALLDAAFGTLLEAVAVFGALFGDALGDAFGDAFCDAFGEAFGVEEALEDAFDEAFGAEEGLEDGLGDGAVVFEADLDAVFDDEATLETDLDAALGDATGIAVFDPAFGDAAVDAAAALATVSDSAAAPDSESSMREVKRHFSHARSRCSRSPSS